jgi:hypothetical protein
VHIISNRGPFVHHFIPGAHRPLFRRSPTTTTWAARAALSMGCAATLALAAGGAQAQSGYTLTALKGPNSQAITPLVLDAQNNVLGTAYYYSGIGVASFPGTSLAVPLFGGLATFYDPAPSRWAATTATTVTPKRIGTFTGQLSSASDDGSKLLVAMRLLDSSSGQILADFTGAQIAGQTPVQLSPTYRSHVVANDGRVLFNANGGQLGTGVWQGSGLSGQLLPGAGGSPTYGETMRGDVVAGNVTESVLAPVQRAAVWRAGQLTVVDKQAGRGSSAQRVSASGHVLMCVMDTATGTGNGAYAPYSRPRSVVQQPDGTEQEVTALQAGQGARAWAMNASGTVVGRMGAGGSGGVLTPSPYYCPPVGDTATSRAFIWRNGVTTDLTTWVTSKGVKLPTGAVLADAFDINDAGSILAIQRASNGTLSYVRLTAKP